MGNLTYTLMADLVVLIHFAFVLFVLLGGVLAFVHPRWMYFHLPAAGWGVIVEVGSYVCPLTPLEIYLRVLGGGESYGTDFVANYILPLLYPEGLTRSGQMLLGGVVAAVNILIYGFWYLRRKKTRPASHHLP